MHAKLKPYISVTAVRNYQSERLLLT